MKPAVLLIVVLGLSLGVYVLLADSSDEDDALTPLPLSENGATDGDGKKSDDKAVTLKAAPTEEPTQVPEVTQLHTPAAALLIGMHDDAWTATLVQAFGRMKELRYATWFLGAADGAAGEAHGLQPPSKKPDAAYLEEQDIRALFFDSADPNALSKECWETIARRVRSGRMGLYVRPNFPKASAVHPALTHPVLKELLPVAEAKPLKGTPVPGVFSRQAQGLVVTDLGVRHPATRFVTSVDDSRTAWGGLSTGAGAIDTRFVYPVTELKPRAQTLVDLEIGDYPAVIVSGTGNARVLWMGNGDFGSAKGGVHFVRSKAKLQGILINQWVMWLVGQAGE